MYGFINYFTPIEQRVSIWLPK